MKLSDRLKRVGTEGGEVPELTPTPVPSARRTPAAKSAARKA